MINDHPSVACQFGKLFWFRHTLAHRRMPLAPKTPLPLANTN